MTESTQAQNAPPPAATLPQQQPQPLPIVEQVQAVSAPLAQVANLPAQPGQPGPAGAPSGFAGLPFQLSLVEQQFVDQILQMWETESDKVKTFNCEFERWEYDAVFGPGNDIPSIKSVGQLTYSKPDKGSFKINEIRRYKQEDPQQPGDWVVQEKEVGEHWVCDGKAIHEYRHDKKQLVVQPLPPEMRGTAIVDGPLPFLFGAEAEKLKRRYWIRSKASNETSIHLEAYPRFQADAANYHHVDVMLDRKKMMPTAIQVHMPNRQSRAVYMFRDETVNGKLDAFFGSIFKAPRTPLGWTRVVEEIPAGPPQQPGPQATAPQETTQR
ncbi:MAG: TIGR03009 domain-containing protein [Pirellulales bacterium]|nr:TIGR03009 domain-containing protein [Pirellulales bacterium]